VLRRPQLRSILVPYFVSQPAESSLLFPSRSGGILKPLDAIGARFGFEKKEIGRGFLAHARRAHL